MQTITCGTRRLPKFYCISHCVCFFVDSTRSASSQRNETMTCNCLDVAASSFFLQKLGHVTRKADTQIPSIPPKTSLHSTRAGTPAACCRQEQTRCFQCKSHGPLIQKEPGFLLLLNKELLQHPQQPPPTRRRQSPTSHASHDGSRNIHSFRRNQASFSCSVRLSGEHSFT